VKFYLLRHGETQWNKLGKFQGFADIPLNQRGLAQARDSARAADTAARIEGKLGGQSGQPAVSGAGNEDAARRAELVVLTVPYAAQRATAHAAAGALAGKILVDATVPLTPPRVARVQLPEGGSAVARLQAELGESVRVVSAFQNVSAHLLSELDRDVDCDVLVCGDDADARETVVRLAASIGLRAWHAGPLANSAVAEGLTSVLISINRRYKARGAGIRISGVGDG